MFRVGIIQLCSKLDYRENLEKIKKYLKDAKAEGVKAIFLPECFYSMSDGLGPTPYLVEHDGEHYYNIKNLAKDFNVALLAGSAATKVGDNIFNRSYNFDEEGNDLGYYDKIHLFACDIEKDGKVVSLNESATYTSGSNSKIINYKELSIGMSICFDVRYPNMYREYAKSGANVLTVPAAFTVPSGRAHWHTLLRARAIESQCFVIAPGQWGVHNDRVSTFGHSLIIDPWGEVLADAEDGEKLIIADLDLSLINKVRSSIKLF